MKKESDLPADDYRRNSPRFQGENFQKNLDLVRKITELAEKKGITASQLALAWVLAQGRDIIPIPGTKRQKYLDENLAAASTTLSPSELKQINAVLPSETAGQRYPAHTMAGVNR